MAESDRIPESLVDVAETLGDIVVLRLMQHFGGRDIRFPERPGEDHPLSAALGIADARALCAMMSGQKVYVPNGRASASSRQEAHRLAQTGLGTGQIARRLGVSERHVRRLNAPPQIDPRQTSMFDED